MASGDVVPSPVGGHVGVTARSLRSQTLVASTYPREVIQLKQWLDQNKGLKDKALAEAMQKQDWDPISPRTARDPELLTLKTPVLAPIGYRGRIGGRLWPLPQEIASAGTKFSAF